MTSSQFRTHLDRLRWSQRGFAAFVGVAHNTVHRWALGQAAIPERMAEWLGWLDDYLEKNPPPK
jgi:DNA-binding transcriptional regulator YiaG